MERGDGSQTRAGAAPGGAAHRERLADCLAYADRAQSAAPVRPLPVLPGARYGRFVPAGGVGCGGAPFAPESPAACGCWVRAAWVVSPIDGLGLSVCWVAGAAAPVSPSLA